MFRSKISRGYVKVEILRNEVMMITQLNERSGLRVQLYDQSNHLEIGKFGDLMLRRWEVNDLAVSFVWQRSTEN